MMPLSVQASDRDRVDSWEHLQFSLPIESRKAAVQVCGASKWSLRNLCTSPLPASLLIKLVV